MRVFQNFVPGICSRRLMIGVSAAWALASAGFASEVKGLFYVGQSETGWQVHVLDLESGKARQLTDSLGDKRSPRYSPSLDAVLFKLPDGRIGSVSPTGGEKIVVDVEGCADFALSEKDHTVFVTKMVTGNTQRQLLWKGVGEFPITHLERYFSAASGSLRQLRMNQDQQLLITHMVPPVLERVCLLVDEGETKSLDYRSEEGEEAAYPNFHPDGRIILSKRVGPSNFDLFILTGAGSEAIPLVESKDYSEFASTADSTRVYFERLGAGGEWSLAMAEPGSNAVQPIPLNTQAKEPFAATLGSNWFEK